MHFRKCVALVVREYAAIHCNIPDPSAVQEEHILAFIKSLNKSYADCVAVIFVALCGVEAKTQKARLMVTDWFCTYKLKAIYGCIPFNFNVVGVGL